MFIYTTCGYYPTCSIYLPLYVSIFFPYYQYVLSTYGIFKVNEDLHSYCKSVIDTFNEDIIKAIELSTELEDLICSPDNDLSKMSVSEIDAIDYFLKAINAARKHIVSRMNRDWRRLYYFFCDYVNHRRGCTLDDVMKHPPKSLRENVDGLTWKDLNDIVRVADLLETL